MVMKMPAIPGQSPSENPEMPAAPAGPDKKKIISAAVNTLWIFLAVQFAASLVLGLILGLIGGTGEALFGYGDGYGYAQFTETISLLAATAAAGLAAIAYGSNHLHVKPREDLEKKTFRSSWIFKGVCMTYTMSMVMSVIVQLINLIGEFFGFAVPSTVIPDNGSVFLRIINIVTVAILAPLFEELIFRGILCKALARYNKGFAVVFTALIFALAHMNLDQGIPVFGMGLVFGFVYLRSNSLWVTIAMHMINNLIALIVQYSSSNFIVSMIFSILVIILAIAGVFFIVKERKEIGSMFRLSGQAKEEWSITGHLVSFWLLVALFVICSVMIILAVSLFNFIYF